MSDLKPHPAAELFPMMSSEELASLAADIKSRGLMQPIVVIEEGGEKLIVDGRNRFAACAIAGAKPRFVPFEGDPFALVVSANLRRRDLTQSQRAMIADSMARMKNGGDRSSAAMAVVKNETLTQPYAAQLFGVSLGSIQRARVVRENGTPELVAAVVEGKVKLRAATVWARKSREAQLDILSGKSPRPRVTPAPEPNPVVVRRPAGRPRAVDKHGTIRDLADKGFTATDICSPRRRR